MASWAGDNPGDSSARHGEGASGRQHAAREAFELDENYKFWPDAKQPARALARARAIFASPMPRERSSVRPLIERQRAAADGRGAANARDQQLQGTLEESNEARAKLGLSLASERDHEKMERLRAALRLTRNWSSAVNSGQHAVDATRSLLLKEYPKLEAELRAEVERARIERELYRVALREGEREHAAHVAKLEAEAEAALEDAAGDTRGGGVSGGA